MTDPVADYLTRVRNAIRAGHKRVDIPASNLKRELTRLLVANKFVASYTEVKEGPVPVLRLQLKYKETRSVITGLKRISRPGLRRFVGAEDLPRVLGGLGVAVISTSRGLLTDTQARSAGVGGEVICEIW
jgi:small subunit ribosomal protein S8